MNEPAKDCHPMRALPQPTVKESEMGKRILPTPEQLRELLRYEAETGKFFWKERDICSFKTRNGGLVWNSRFSGKEAFITRHKGGYLDGVVFYKKMLAHRVAWAIHYGSWPDEQVDHINGVRDDNRIGNLRGATSSQNKCNAKRRSDNSSGFKGVYFDKRSGSWIARVQKDGKCKNIGSFGSAEEAHSAYCREASKIHAEFARFC